MQQLLSGRHGIFSLTRIPAAGLRASVFLLMFWGLARADAPRVGPRTFPEGTPLVRDGEANVLIVYGDAHRAAAEGLQERLGALYNVAFPMMRDLEATGGRLWTLDEAVQDRNLLLLGDINTNRGILQLYAKFLDATTGRFPGPGRYVLRHLAEPLVPGRTALVIGAGDAMGLQLGIDRFLAHLENPDPDDPEVPAVRPVLGFPLLEFGDADGPRPSRDGPATFRDFRDAAYVFYAGGRAPARFAWFDPRDPHTAMNTARELVQADLDRDTPYIPVGGHYLFTPMYQALRIIVAHGLLSAEELQRLEEKLTVNALENRDGYVNWVRDRRDGILSGARKPASPSRHSITAVVGHYLLLDYMVRFANLRSDVRTEIETDYAAFRRLIEELSDSGMFRSRVGDREALDCTAFFIYGFMHLGLEEFVHNGVLENMASFYLNSVNNLWTKAGACHYIGAYFGAHLGSPTGGLAVRMLAFFTEDRALDALDGRRYEQAGTYRRGFNDRGGMQLNQPEPFALPPVEGDTPVFSAPLLGKTPLDPLMWPQPDEQPDDRDETPSSPPQRYDVIAFRDGWDDTDAFLSIKGIQRDGARPPLPWQIQTIVGHTELGARFLFGGSMTHEAWHRSSITVDTTGYRGQDEVARLVAYIPADEAALIASVNERHNGMRWQRTIVRRKGAYFVVLDDLTAIEEDDFRVTLTWRALPPGAIDPEGVFRAVGDNGAEFAIVPGGPYPAVVTRPEVDGASRPTFYRQQRDVSLRPGETVRFHNALLARPPGTDDRVTIRTTGDGNLLHIQTHRRDPETALAGTRHLPERPGLPAGECAAFFLAEDLWLVGGTRELRLDGELLLQSTQSVDFVIDWSAGQAEIRVWEPDPVSVALAPAFGGSGDFETLAPGSHRYRIGSTRPEGLQTALTDLTGEASDALETNAGIRTVGTEPESPSGSPVFEERWRRIAQPPAAAVLRPIRVSTDRPADAMALANIHNGVPSPGAIPPASWRERELVLSLEPWMEGQRVTGLRVIGSGIGDLDVETPCPESESGYRALPFEEQAEALFAVHSVHRVGATRFPVRRLDFNGEVHRFRLRLTAADPESPHLQIGEIQLLGEPQPTGVRGRLRVEQMHPEAPPIVFCRTGLLVDTLEQGGRLQAFSLEGEPLWTHPESAPAQYRDAYWLTGDMHPDGRRQLITYDDDMVIRVFDADGKVRTTVDLAAWEEARQETPLGGSRYGGKSIALWPERDGRRHDLFVFGHVHHHQIHLEPEPRITRRDRVPTWNCAPAAHVAVEGWTGPGSRNLVGVAPYEHVVVLWEDRGPDAPPELMRQRRLDEPLVQPGANSQLPAFVDARLVHHPAGVLAATPRGLQFFAAPDLEPGWVFAGMAPLSALTTMAADATAGDRIYLGRENGRVVRLEAGSGRALQEILLPGAVRRLAVCEDGRLVAGTTEGLFLLDEDLRMIGRHAIGVEDLAVATTETGQIRVLILSRDGDLSAFQIRTDDPNEKSLEE